MGVREIPIFLILFVVFLIDSGTGVAGPREQAIRLFNRLAGVPPTEAQVDEMAQKIASGKLSEAAAVATNKAQSPSFYNTTVKHFASALSNREQSSLRELNDFIATIVGIARDDVDFRETLTGDFIYVGNETKMTNANLGNDNSRKNNRNSDAHYTALANANLVDMLEKLALAPVAQSLTVAIQNQHPIAPYREPGSPANDPNNTKMSEITEDDTAGLLTTRTWALEHLIAGTNRRAIEYALLIFMCKPMLDLADGTMPDYHVRRDVDRAPLGSSAVFHAQCHTCHAGMDALGGAYARYDYNDDKEPLNQLTVNKHSVSPKMNKLPIYFEGKMTTDDSWENFFTQNQNQALGWKNALSGRGIKQFGAMVANSRQFSVCMASRVFQSVCYRKHELQEQSYIETLASQFESGSYNLRRLFEEAAVLPICLGKE